MITRHVVKEDTIIKQQILPFLWPGGKVEPSTGNHDLWNPCSQGTFPKKLTNCKHFILLQKLIDQSTDVHFHPAAIIENLLGPRDRSLDRSCDFTIRKK